MVYVEIVGELLPDPIQPSTCHPTTSENNSLSLIEEVDLKEDADYDSYQSFAVGVTPILTVFMSQNSNTSGTKFVNPEIGLTCVKPVAQILKPTADQSGGSKMLLSSSWANSAVAVTVAAQIFWWFL